MTKAENINRILFISMGGIGNLIMLTPAIQAICKHFPDATLDFLLPKNRSREIIELHPQIGEIIETGNSWHDVPTLISKLRKLNPDLVFSATGTNPLRCGLLGLISGAEYRLGESFKAGKCLYNLKVPYQPEQHEVMSNFLMAGEITGENEQPDLCIWSSGQDKNAAVQKLDGNKDNVLIGIHPGSGPKMDYKRWPEGNFAELCTRIAEKHTVEFLVFGGPEEKEAAGRIAGKAIASIRNLAGELTVRESYEAMKRCGLFISNDSGPMHLAAAAGTKVLALFGPTLEYRTSPWGKGHMIITADESCRPCYKYRPVVCKDYKCMENISIEQVLQKSDDLLKDIL